MRLKIFSLILLFFVVLSNISFSLTSIYSFFIDKNNLNVYDTINIQEQCSMLVNIPKNLINICVKVSYDIKSFATAENKKQSIVSDNYKFDQAPIALMVSTMKTKVAKNLCEYRNLLFTFENVSLQKFIIPIIIFYLLYYIGLLRLFGSISLLSLQIGNKDDSVYVLS